MRLLTSALAIILTLTPITQARADSPVVIELFTSQGCSACPPADALLAELATRDDVIALALHVDYWDYIGWADTFASRQFTYRQNSYARAAGRQMIYTPQMIIGGAEHVVGNEPMAVADLLMAHRAVDYPVHVTLTRSGGALHIGAIATMAMPEGGMIVQIVRFDPIQSVQIGRGENAGHTIEYTNIVTDWTNLGNWTGEEDFAMSLADTSTEPAVAIVQMPGPGLILGAARLN